MGCCIGKEICDEARAGISTDSKLLTFSNSARTAGGDASIPQQKRVLFVS